MRVKKYKHTRRAVAFYRINYGFHEPYKMLLDGNFVHTTLEANLGDLPHHIPKLLGGRCKLYTTPCVLRELRALGKEYAGSAKAAGSYEIHKCGHVKGDGTAAAACLLAQIGASNEQHWFVATQDRSLRLALAKKPGCPCLFATANGLQLEAPPEKAKSAVHKSELQARSVPEHELHTTALEGLASLRPKDRSHAIFRRNFAKGPNPLSIKKKVSKPTHSAPSAAPQSLAGAAPSKSAAETGHVHSQKEAQQQQQQQQPSANEAALGMHDGGGQPSSASAAPTKRKRVRSKSKAAAAKSSDA